MAFAPLAGVGDKLDGLTWVVGLGKRSIGSFFTGVVASVTVEVQV